MTNVATLQGKASPSVEDVLNWVHQKGARGELGENAARLRCTALKQLTSILDDSEPQDARWVLAEISSIARRWATKHNANGATARTYESRARGTLEDYFRWAADPVGFRFGKSTNEDRPKGGERTARPRRTKAAVPPPEPPSFPQPAAPMRSFPLQHGVFEFRLPESGLTVRDCRRIVCHLLTLSSDFDPTDPGHTQVFSATLTVDR